MVRRLADRKCATNIGTSPRRFGHERCVELARLQSSSLVEPHSRWAWAMMGLIAIFSNLLLGYRERRRGLPLLVLPIIVSIAFLLIADIDTPRGGLIGVSPQNLLLLRESITLP